MSIVNKIIKTYSLRKIMNNKQIANVNFFIKNNITNINNIEVDEEFRKQNIGSELLKDIENFSKTKGVEKILLTVLQLPNDSLINFYLKNNYKIYKNNSYFDDGENIYDVIQLSRII
tara:strand:+ start:420 stop:770 length:351 start_codon:yes stop_codon:yes gene_type:complete